MDPISAIQQASQYWAQQYGIDANKLTAISIATAQQESGFDPNIVGDNGTSFGLFQLHQGGELGSLTPTQAKDPLTNAMTAIQNIADTFKNHPDWSPGEIAAAAQRPADPTGYAQSVNTIFKQDANGGLSGILNGAMNSVGKVFGGLGMPTSIGNIGGPSLPTPGGGNFMQGLFSQLQNSPQGKYWWLVPVGLLVVLIGLFLLIQDNPQIVSTAVKAVPK